MKIVFLLLFLAILSGPSVFQCDSWAGQDVLHARVLSFITGAYPNLVLYEEKMMNEIARKDFNEYVPEGNPGITCGRFRSGSVNDCAVLFAHKDILDRGAYLLMYVMNAESDVPVIFPLDTYGCIQYGGDVYMHFVKQDIIPDRENLTRVSMKGDGFEVVFSGHTSHAYFWDGGVLRKVYTSD